MTFDEEMIARLLQPIEGEAAPVGLNGRRGESATRDRFDSLKESVNELRNSENRPRGASDPDGAGFDGDSGFENWSGVSADSINYLSDHAKDLEAGCFLVEASVREEGLAGLRDGLALLMQLIDAYWDQGLHPAEDADEEDEEERITGRFIHLTNLSGDSIDGKGLLLAPLRRLPLVGNLSFAQKMELDAAARRRSKALGTDREDEEAAAYNRLQGAVEDLVQRASVDAARETIAQVQASLAAWNALRDGISARSPYPLANGGLGEMLGTLESWLTSLFDSRLAQGGDSPAAVSDDSAAASGTVAMTDGGSPMPQRGADRAGALAAILDAADYFDRAEPLSPIGPALREVHRRARLSFHELMLEVIPDEDRRESFYLHCGIKTPQTS